MHNKKISRYLSIAFIIKKAQLDQRPHITYKFHKDFVPMLDILAKHGFIRSFDITDNGRIFIIWLKGTRDVAGIWKPSFSDVSRLPYYQRNPGSISFPFLRRLTQHDGGSSIYILNTDKGVITHLDAIRLNIGGKMLFKII